MSEPIDFTAIWATRQPIEARQQATRRLRRTIASLHQNLRTFETALIGYREGIVQVAARYDQMAADVTACQRFCQACREAWELDDLEEMIRRRDRLLAERNA